MMNHQKEYNNIWKKVENTIHKEFDCESVYSEKDLKAKIRSYNGKVNTNSHYNKISKYGSPYICLSVILVNYVFGTGKNYYP